MRVTLTVTEGPHTGLAFTFTEHDTFIVGRSKRAHFRLASKDKYFSRHHFVIEVNPPHCRLLDLGSRNGTYINGVRTPSADLRDGDLIKAGRTIIRAAIETPPIKLSDLAPTIRPAVPVARFAPAAELPCTVIPGRPPLDPLRSPPTLNYVPSAVGSPDRRPSGSNIPLCPACDAPTPPDTLALNDKPYSPMCAACENAAQKLPQPFPGLQIVRELGRGAMGVVHLAMRLSDRTPVALKTIIPSSEATPADISRFIREASILRELDHPNIVAFRDMGESNGVLYLAMDYVRGTTASRLVKQYRGGMPIDRAVELVCQLLEALGYAHTKKFVHRDIKPGNLMVTGCDVAGITRDVVKLADFGLARVYQSSSFSGLTIRGEYGGTYPFMPPEQITNYREALPTNDLYSAGATLYNLLTGRFVYDFPPEIQQKVLMLLQDAPVPIRSRRPDIPPALAEIIHRSLAREPLDRFVNARTMQDALAPYRLNSTVH